MHSQELNRTFQSFHLPNTNMKVVSFRRNVKPKRPKVVFIIAFCQLIIWLFYLGLQSVDYLLYFIPENLTHVSFFTKMYSALKHVFSYSTVWFSISSLLGFIGLINMKSWGWVIALVTNSLYISMIASNYMTDVIHITSTYNYFTFFLILFTIISTIYLWFKRFCFWK